MGKIIGIDLGTTNSVVAVMEGSEPSVITNREGVDVGRRFAATKTASSSTPTATAAFTILTAPLALRWSLLCRLFCLVSFCLCHQVRHESCRRPTGGLRRDVGGVGRSVGFDGGE